MKSKLQLPSRESYCYHRHRVNKSGKTNGSTAEGSMQGTVFLGFVDPRTIHFLSSTLEAYEGVAVVTTVDSDLGLVRIHAAPDCEDDVLAIIGAESKFTGWVPAEPA
ncbi:DUF4911 domain-containing protein [Desulfoglaeba alkanexedens ALDC]|uniref:DUF4911 domain-containing protein n=2 Tax=Desulfoglaeba alkanexedens TaxID=361111 RepID=A0A4P8L5J7_9BACT|nr:DUF4911 domain-containing protein [Desulfoglaeba alkanexedens ALDC]